MRDSLTSLETRGQITCRPYVTISTIKPSTFYQELLAEFTGLTKPSLPPAQRKHGVFHRIETTGPPVVQPFRRLTPEKLKIAKAEFAYLMETGVLQTTKQSLGLTVSHGTEESTRSLETMRRLSKIQFGYDTRSLPITAYL